MPLDTDSYRYLQEIEILISQRVGFDARIIGSRKISRAVENRRVACRLRNIEAYLTVLQSSPQEFSELIEQLVVPETWFFRDRKPFDFLVNFVQTQWLAKSGAPKLRVLSVPCSTGEEPYSIAMALLEAGLSVNRFSVDAVDISHQALTKAQRAIYGKNSFRGEDWVERNRYFQNVDGKYSVCSLVRNTVNFRQGNLLNEVATISRKYDIIFCRNLLIYLEDVACQYVLNTLYQLLKPEGLLFVGASETGKVSSDRFAYIRQAFTFAYRKIDTVPDQSSKATLEPIETKPVLAQASTQPVSHLDVKAIASTRRHAPLASAKHQISVVPPIHSLQNVTLQQAQQLADAGNIASAIHCCKTYLESHSTHAEANALLGTLYQATADYEQAEHCFRRALYLQPNLYEALMHLALLKESRGDAIAAERLRQRIQKLQPNS